MIKFFRKIRQKLLTENKFSKYLLYTIGEIVLVVIGILIALSINNWNDDRKIADQETLYLKRLLSDNKQDYITFSNFIRDLKKGNETIEQLSKALNTTINDSLLVVRANEFIEYGSIFPIFSSSKSTFIDLSSTGNLSVIKDFNLRDQIVNHYAQHDYMQQRIQISTEWTIPLDGSLYTENNAMNFETSTAFLYPNTSIKVLASELRDNKLAYINNIASHHWINSDAIDRFEKLKEQTAKIIDKIEKQLTE
ncbi:DUF6090 family protein [uncultured Maribacter sp.]|uniref:DUF6090 family protein n=1 Tax=uncultured Maribacter sp. TaxID=431308 RepID=UPI0030D90A67